MILYTQDIQNSKSIDSDIQDSKRVLTRGKCTREDSFSRIVRYTSKITIQFQGVVRRSNLCDKYIEVQVVHVIRSRARKSKVMDGHVLPKWFPICYWLPQNPRSCPRYYLNNSKISFWIMLKWCLCNGGCTKNTFYALYPILISQFLMAAHILLYLSFCSATGHKACQPQTDYSSINSCTCSKLFLSLTFWVYFIKHETNE